MVNTEVCRTFDSLDYYTYVRSSMHDSYRGCDIIHTTTLEVHITFYRSSSLGLLYSEYM
jgi:hypothetical protein